MKTDEVPTPAVLIDLDKLERNIAKMQAFVKSKGCNIRPHAKSHKSPFIAKKQIQAGAIGQCAQTLGETEALVFAGIDHILLTHNLASANSIDRFLSLKRNADVMITVDGTENAGMLASAARRRGLTADVIVEVNIGNNKSGQEPGEPAAKFARWVTETEGLRLRGIMGYEGNIQLNTPNFDERKTKALAALDGMTQTISSLKTMGITPEIVTCGGTGTYNITAGYPGVTEIQPGSYIYMDRRYGEIKTSGDDFEHAMTVIGTVVSTATPTRAVTDIGWKAVGIEYEGLGIGGMPSILLPGLRYRPGGDEHGVLEAEDPKYRPNVGDRVRVIPAHCDTTLNMYSNFYGVRGDNVEVVCPVARR